MCEKMCGCGQQIKEKINKNFKVIISDTFTFLKEINKMGCLGGPSGDVHLGRS